MKKHLKQTTKNLEGKRIDGVLYLEYVDPILEPTFKQKIKKIKIKPINKNEEDIESKSN